MPTRKINDLFIDSCITLCLDPEHNPPTHQVFEPGTYEHECPKCHNRIYFTIPAVIY